MHSNFNDNYIQYASYNPDVIPQQFRLKQEKLVNYTRVHASLGSSYIE